MTDARPTLRSLLALPDTPAGLSKSALVLIDCQQTYREGIMQLEGVEPALKECATLLKPCARRGRTGHPHPARRRGPARPYDTTAPIGAIADVVAPATGRKGHHQGLSELLRADGSRRGIEAARRHGSGARGLHDACVRELDGAGCVQSRLPRDRRGQCTATRALANPRVAATLSARRVHNGALTALVGHLSRLWYRRETRSRT